MAEIKIDRASVDTIVNNLNEKKQELDGYILELKSNLEGILSTAWKDTNSKAYVNKMQEQYCGDLEKLSACIESFSVYLANVYSEYELVDQETSSQVDEIEV